jgi:hypothetical protein
MDMMAIERFNRNRDISNHICNIVEDWMDGVEEVDDIGVSDWVLLQENIERYLNERDAE